AGNGSDTAAIPAEPRARSHRDGTCGGRQDDDLGGIQTRGRPADFDAVGRGGVMMLATVSRRNVATLALLACSLLAAAASARGATYTFVTLVFPPMEFVDAKGEAAGAAVDVVRLVMGNLGHNVRIKVLPWSRSLDMVREGKADAIFTAYQNP